MHHLYLVLLSSVLVLSACGSETAPPASEPAPVPAVEPAPTTAPAPGAAEPAAAEVSVTVENLTQEKELGSDPVTLTATTGVNQISVHLENLTTYCDPAPSFTAAVVGEALELRLVRPEVVSRCALPHSLDAVIALPGRNNVRRVVLLDADERTLGTATVNAAPKGASCYVKGAGGECWSSTEEACEALGCPAGSCICTEATSNNTCHC